MGPKIQNPKNGVMKKKSPVGRTMNILNRIAMMRCERLVYLVSQIISNMIFQKQPLMVLRSKPNIKHIQM